MSKLEGAPDGDRTAEKSKKLEEKLLNWFLGLTTPVAIIIAVFLMKNKENIKRNNDKKIDIIEMTSEDCRKKIIELTKTNDSLRNVILLNKELD